MRFRHRKPDMPPCPVCGAAAERADVRDGEGRDVTQYRCPKGCRAGRWRASDAQARADFAAWEPPRRGRHARRDA